MKAGARGDDTSKFESSWDRPQKYAVVSTIDLRKETSARCIEETTLARKNMSSSRPHVQDKPELERLSDGPDSDGVHTSVAALGKKKELRQSNHGQFGVMDTSEHVSTTSTYPVNLSTASDLTNSCESDLEKDQRTPLIVIEQEDAYDGSRKSKPTSTNNCANEDHDESAMLLLEEENQAPNTSSPFTSADQGKQTTPKSRNMSNKQNRE